jgi:PAS domain S-box-containing protein
MDAAETAVRGPSAPALVVRLAASVAGLVGFIVLLGWIADIPAFRSLVADTATMKANTAVGLLLSAASLWLASGERPGAGRIPAIAAAAVGVLTIGQYATGTDFGIDQLLFRDPDPMSAPFPGRMSIPTAANFLLFGAAMALPRLGSPTVGFAFTALCSVGLLGTVLVLIGYGYSIPLLYRPHPYASTAIHTAISFAVLFVGALATRPSIGWAATLRSNRAGGAVARRMLPFAFLLPLLLGWVVLQGERHGLYDTAAAIAVFAVISLMIFAAVGWSISHVVDRLDVVRRRTEAALIASESLFLAFVQNAPFVTYVKDRDGRYIFHNPEGERVFKATDAAMRGKTARDFHDPATAAEIEAIEQRIVATGQPVVVEKRTSASGPYEWVMVIKFPVRDQSGQVIGIGGFDIDISERKRAEAAAHKVEQNYHRVVELGQEAIWIHADGKVVFANPAAAKLFGVDRPEALVGQTATGWIHPDDREHAAARTRILTMQPCAVPVTEMRLLGLDGQMRTAAIHAVSFLQDGKIQVMASARDVTEQRQAEAQLTQAQKMEAVGQLTGGVAHDFNNLLTVIIGTLDMTLERAQGDLRPMLDTALRAAQRGATLVQRLLAFSRRQALKPEPLDINRLAADMEELLRRTLGEHIAIEMKLLAGLWPALADRSQVESALLNLAVNARDAMPAGGKMTIETGNVHLDEAYVARNVEVGMGDYIVLAVTDTGSGMPPEVLERAFEPFFTTKEVGRGSGLGLSMIYGFAKQSRGHLKIYSEVAHGTTVRLYLPRVVGDSTATTAAAAAAEHPRGGETILVVEDDADVRQYVVSQIHDLGYRVIEAADGPQAQRILDGDTPIDLLFTDVVMPGGMTGRQLADAAKERRPTLKTLFTSGYTENSIVHQGKLDPGVHFLAKPYRRQELAAKLREALDQAD